MAFRKYQSVEKSDVVSKQGHDAIKDELRRTGKTRVSDMDEEEKKAVSTRLASTGDTVGP